MLFAEPSHRPRTCRARLAQAEAAADTADGDAAEAAAPVLDSPEEAAVDEAYHELRKWVNVTELEYVSVHAGRESRRGRMAAAIKVRLVRVCLRMPGGRAGGGYQGARWSCAPAPCSCLLVRAGWESRRGRAAAAMKVRACLVLVLTRDLLVVPQILTPQIAASTPRRLCRKGPQVIESRTA